MIDFGISEKKAEALAKRMEDCGLKETDIEEKFVRSQGPGGQHVNKTSSCVQLTHTPTQISVKIQRTRKQPMNRFYARRRLCELLELEQLGKNSPLAKKATKLKKQKDRRRRRTAKKIEDRKL